MVLLALLSGEIAPTTTLDAAKDSSVHKWMHLGGQSASLILATHRQQLPIQRLIPFLLLQNHLLLPSNSHQLLLLPFHRREVMDVALLTSRHAIIQQIHFVL